MFLEVLMFTTVGLSVFASFTKSGEGAAPQAAAGKEERSTMKAKNLAAIATRMATSWSLSSIKLIMPAGIVKGEGAEIAGSIALLPSWTTGWGIKKRTTP
jgi:hypothetical protein